MKKVDDVLLKYMDEVPPRFNPEITQGLAQGMCDEFIEYIHGILKMASKTLQNQGKKITYLGYSYVSPEKRILEETRPINNKQTFEITRSDYRMVQFNLAFDGHDLKPRYLTIPFLGQGGTFYLSGSKYHVVPTISDELFSIEKGSIFMPVTRARLCFRREGYYFYADNALISADYYWAKLHHSTSNDVPKTRYPQLFNYILASVGFTEAFRSCFNAVVRVVNESLVDSDEIESEYPSDEWVICSSAGNRPRGRIQTGTYVTPTLRIAVQRSDFEQRSVMSAICSVFYIADIMGDLPAFNWLEFEEPYMWKRVLAAFLWRTADEREAMVQLDEHLNSISEYIDDYVVRRLRHVGVEAITINEVFSYIINNFHILVAHTDPGDMSHKQLTITPNIMFGVQIMIFNIMFMMLRLPDEKMTWEKINRILDYEWKIRTLMGVNTNHPEVQVLESTTDQKVFKIGRVAHYPSKFTAKQKSSEMRDPAFFLHWSMSYVCSWGFITKASPSGRGSLNCFLKLDDNGRVQLPEHLRAKVMYLKNKMENNHVADE